MIKILLAGALFLPVSSRAVSWEEAQPMAADLVKNMQGAQPLSGSPAVAESAPTALQRHISFFDKDGNGAITRTETVLSLRQLGLRPAKASAAAFLIHVFLGPKTTGSWRNLDISVKDIKLGKHGSDTGAFDAEGRFVPAAFERMFDEFDADRSSSLSGTELEAMIAVNAKLRPGSEAAAKQEFQLLLQIAADATADEGGKRVPAISRRRLQDFYDGSLFFKLAKPV